MATVTGDLIQAMRAYVRGGNRLAVLVIDEQGDDIPNPYLTAQQRVLRCARLLGMPIVFIELNPNPGEKANRATSSDLRHAAAGAQSQVVTKSGFNSFVGTRLADVLEVYQATALVVLGRETNQCVKNTVIGGSESSKGDRVADGAVQKGFLVLSSDLIVRTGVAQWQKDYPEGQLAFYTHVLEMDARALVHPKPKPLPKPGSKPLPPIPKKPGSKPLPPIPQKKT
jgi:nicotinamidase-related amidase